MFTPMLVIIGQWFDKKKGKAMGVASMGCGLGSIVIAPLCQYWMSSSGFYYTMVSLSGVLLHGLVAGSLLWPPPVIKLKESVICQKSLEPSTNELQIQNPETGNHSKEDVKTSEKRNIDDHDNVDPDERDGQNNFSICTCLSVILRNGPWKEFIVLRHPVFLLYCFNLGTMSYAVIFYLLFLPSLAYEMGFTKQSGSLLLALAGGFDIAGRLIWGAIFDLRRIRPHRRLIHSILGVVLALTALVTGLAPPSFPIIATLVALWGIFQGGYHGQRITVVSQYVPTREFTSAVGVLILFQGLGNLTCPLVSG